MKLIKYTDIKPTHFDNGPGQGRRRPGWSSARPTAPQNFCMRVFEIAPGGHTPKHAHDWEHEMVVHAGAGEVYGNGQWQPMNAGKVLFIPANEEHQMQQYRQGVVGGGLPGAVRAPRSYERPERLMLRELAEVRQVSAEPERRWFADD